MWIVPVPFCGMRYDIEGRYLPRDKAPESDRRDSPSENNVDFF